ncbi:MAG: hypothetical protein ABW101_01445 [Candidatus Thiodiazotropha sp.]
MDPIDTTLGSEVGLLEAATATATVVGVAGFGASDLFSVSGFSVAGAAAGVGFGVVAAVLAGLDSVTAFFFGAAFFAVATFFFATFFLAAFLVAVFFCATFFFTVPASSAGVDFALSSV